MNSDITDSEMWREVAKLKQEKRASNRESSQQLIHNTGVEYVVNNGGAHIIITCNHGVIDFWPGTGKYMTRKWLNGYTMKGRGVRYVLDLIERSKQ